MGMSAGFAIQNDEARKKGRVGGGERTATPRGRVNYRDI